MTLQELWDKMVAAAGPQDQVIAGVYAPHIAELSDDLGDLYEPQEYPKWVGDRVAESAEHERALRGELEAPAATAAAAVDGDAPGPAEPETTPPSLEPNEAPMPDAPPAQIDPVDPPSPPAEDPGVSAGDASAAGEAAAAPAAEGGAQ